MIKSTGDEVLQDYIIHLMLGLLKQQASLQEQSYVGVTGKRD